MEKLQSVLKLAIPTKAREVEYEESQYMVCMKMFWQW